jgi:hypothetical protein
MKYIGQTGRTFRTPYKEHTNTIRTNKQNSKFVQHILETGHNYDTIDHSMKILQIEMKGPKLNTLERFHIYDKKKKGLQMNDTFTDIHKPIFDILIKTHTHKQPLPTSTHSTILAPTHTNKPHTQYLYTQEPQ